MADVAQQQALIRPVYDDAEVAAHADGPEVLVLGPVELVELHPRIGRIHLKVERRRLGGSLLIARQASKAIGDCAGNAEFRVTQSNPSITVTTLLAVVHSVPVFGILETR